MSYEESHGEQYRDDSNQPYFPDYEGQIGEEIPDAGDAFAIAGPSNEVQQQVGRYDHLFDLMEIDIIEGRGEQPESDSAEQTDEVEMDVFSVEARDGFPLVGISKEDNHDWLELRRGAILRAQKADIDTDSEVASGPLLGGNAKTKRKPTKAQVSARRAVARHRRRVPRQRVSR